PARSHRHIFRKHGLMVRSVQNKAEAHAKNRAREGGQSPPRQPRVALRRLFIESSSHTRQQRRRHFFVRYRRQALFELTEQPGLRFEVSLARRAVLLVRCHSAGELRLSRRQGVQNSFLRLLAVHRSFSARCFLAKNSLDFTVPIGMPSMPDTSSSV